MKRILYIALYGAFTLTAAGMNCPAQGFRDAIPLNLLMNAPPPWFAIYLAADIPDRAHRVEEPASFQHKLQEKPWLTEDDIEFYDFSTHAIHLNKGKTVQFGPTGQAFAVFAMGKRCYTGYFYSLLSSYLEPGPTIETMSLSGEASEDVIKIKRYMMRGAPDVRNDARIKDALQKAGKLKSGLTVALNDVKLIRRTFSTTALSYTFTITNTDDEDIYALDPAKTGDKWFHFYTNGLFLTGKDGSLFGSSRGSRDFSGFDPDKTDEGKWFTKIKSRGSMRRTVTADSYPYIPDGGYSCDFKYASPPLKNGKSMPAGARAWAGDISAPPFFIHIK